VEVKFDDAVRKELVQHAPASGAKLDAIELGHAELFEHYLHPGDLLVDPAQLELLPLGPVVRMFMRQAQLNFGRRLWTLLDDFIHLTNASRPYALAMVARALIETTAKLVHFREKCRPLENRVETDEAKIRAFLTEIDKVVYGSRFDWASLLKSPQTLIDSYGKSMKKSLPARVEATNVITLVESLNKRHAQEFDEVGMVGFLYSYLSDLVHPAAGGDMLVIRPAPGLPGVVRFGATPTRESIRFLLLKAAVPSAEICCRHMLALSQLTPLIEGFTSRPSNAGTGTRA